MGESDDGDEGAVFLEDEQSMDEMHELDDALVTSVDTLASPTRTTEPLDRASPGDSDSDFGDSDDDDDDDGDDDDDDDDEDDDDEASRKVARSKPKDQAQHAGDRGAYRQTHDDDLSDSESDEPPEIPGSPFRSASPDAKPSRIDSGQMNRLGDFDIGKCGELSRKRNESKGPPNVDILRIQDDEDYEIRDSEQPRAMEFHSSSSSDSGDDGASSDFEVDGQRSRQQPQKLEQHTSRPKTAAVDLENYRDLVPPAYFDKVATTSKTELKNNESGDVRNATPEAPSIQTARASSFILHVPQDIANLFDLVSEYRPEEIELPTRLEPFIPEYVPVIGSPFDGIQIPRPDLTEDDIGIQVVREPSAQSNVAELELLLKSMAKSSRLRQGVETVHSIEDSCHRPKEIDRWIASVAKLQSTKPIPRVMYKKPMPSISTLMELWPEAFETFLDGSAPIPISRLSASLSELVKIVCGVLDIPVYEGQYLHSLHVLFSLYYEVEMYEREMQTKTLSETRFYPT